ncbi:MAG: dihydroorotate dehydrogenase electron transfer subunit [Clostridiales bacterium]|nr:dihydroorotate dehydrogenase electron transfer subunit [Clostridiales bacterium]
MTEKKTGKKLRLKAWVVSQEALAPDIFSMWIQAEEIATEAKPGQFLSVYTKDAGKLLPRPISLCEIDRTAGRLRIVYRAVGAGTREFSHYQAGDAITVLGPLGNGFPLDDERKSILFGGGIGIPPMLELARQLPGEKQIVLGYRDQLFLNEEFASYGTVYVATEDGSAGTKGNVLDVVCANGLEADVIYACGPTPMLRAIRDYALKNDIACWLSLEERMACGIGACLACVCRSREIDGHSHVHNKRVCKDGPVFAAGEVEL